MLRLLDAGRSTRQIERLLGVSRSKVSEIDGDEKKRRRRERDRKRQRNELHGGELDWLSDTTREQIISALPLDLDDVDENRLLAALEMNASVCRVDKRVWLSTLDASVSSILEVYFGAEAGEEILRNAKAEITEILRRHRGGKPRQLNLGEMPAGTAAKNRVIRVAPRKPPDPQMVAVGVALRSGERAPLLKHRIEELVHERGLRLMKDQPEKYPTIEQARVAAWDRNPDLKRAYYERGLVPVATARKDPALSEECRPLGIRLN